MNLTLNNFMAYILAITMVIQSYSKVFFASDTIFQNIFFYALVFFSILIVSISKFRLIDIFLIITSLIIYLAFGNGFALKLFLVSLAVRCLDINKLLRCYLLLATIAFITVILFNVGGDNSLIYFKGDGVFRIARETLGFDNPNKPFYYLLPIFCCFVFLYFKRYPISCITAIIIVTYAVYIKTLTTTGLFSNALLVLMLLIYYFLPNKTNRILGNPLLITCSIIVLYFASFFIAFTYHSDSNVNFFLSHRPEYWYEIIRTTNIYLLIFGQALDLQLVPLDNSYIHSVIYMGAFFCIIMIFCYWLGLTRAKLRGVNISIISILCIYVFFYSFGETLLVGPTLNITFIIIFNYIRDHNKYESIDLQP